MRALGLTFESSQIRAVVEGNARVELNLSFPFSSLPQQML